MWFPCWVARIYEQVVQMQAIPDVRFVDLSKIPFPGGHRPPKLFNGYVQKIFSLYSTKFDQVFTLTQLPLIM